VNRTEAPPSGFQQWAIAIIASRESVETLCDVLRKTTNACGHIPARIDLLINGNEQLAIDLGKAMHSWPVQPNLAIYLWSFSYGDKAATWNAYIHDMNIVADHVFILDGYTRPETSSFSELVAALNAHPDALAATGVPSVGASATTIARAMIRDGGIHGNMFVLSSRAVAEFRRRAIRLPIGLYRVDSLIGAIINFNFDPRQYQWNKDRIAVQPGATWCFEPLKFWRIKDLLTQLKRRSRQIQGVLENKSIRSFLAIQRKPPEKMPETVQELVTSWWHSQNGPLWYEVLLHPEWNNAYRNILLRKRNNTSFQLPPKLIQQI